MLHTIQKSFFTAILPLFIVLLYFHSHEFSITGTLFSITPPVITVYFALVSRHVYLSLFAGIFSGCFLLTGGDFLKGTWDALMKMLSVFLGDPANISMESIPFDNLKIIAFAYLLGGMIAICVANGGMAGIMGLFSAFANSALRAQLSTWAMGLMIFFDDYTNCLLVGNTMRPITDRFKISRAKLAYIVDSTAAPIATIAPISTWVGYELGLFTTAIKSNEGLEQYSALSLFLHSLPFSYYAIFSLLFILLLILTGRDFGPMYESQVHARQGERIEDGNFEKKGHWLPGVAPILSVILATLIGLYITGMQNLLDKGAEASTLNLGIILSSGNSGTSLLIGALSGCILAILLSKLMTRMDLHSCWKVLRDGGIKMIPPTLVLCLSWSLGMVCHEMKTGDFVSLLVKLHLPEFWLPVLVFLTSAIIAFATGTSWGCMAIMVPIVLGIDSLHQGENLHLLFGSVSAILGGASFGDHCSPISDTTVLSSMAAEVDHLEHVKTQVPYACLVGFCVSMAYLFNSMTETGPWIGMVGGILLMAILLFLLGRKVDTKAIPIPQESSK